MRIRLQIRAKIFEVHRPARVQWSENFESNGVDSSQHSPLGLRRRLLRRKERSRSRCRGRSIRGCLFDREGGNPGQAGDRRNSAGLVLGCIHAEFYN